jgi:hypothetical protein
MQSRLLFGKTAFLRVVTALVSKQTSGFFGFGTLAGRKRSIELVPVLVHVNLAIQEIAQSHPNILVTKCPSVKIEDCIFGVF